MELVTGVGEKPHVTSADDRELYEGIFGDGTYAIKAGEQFRAEVQTNNLIKIYDGSMIVQGAHIRIRTNLPEEAVIENGTQGEKRSDLIVIRYEKKADTGIESATIATVKGTPSESTPQDPVVRTGDIRAGDLIHEEPIYRVNLDGINITSIDKLFEVAPSIAELQKKCNELNSAITDNTTVDSGYCTLPNGLLLQWGITTASYANANVLWVTKTFPKEFKSSQPTVLAQIYNNGNDAIDLQKNVKIKSVSAKTFVAYVHNSPGGYTSASTEKLIWFAIGY